VSTGSWDPADLFDEDYLTFVRERVSDSATDAELSVLLSVLPLPAGQSVLDLACGHGRLSNRLAARGLVVTGLDITPQFLEAARADAAARGVAVEYVEGDMRSIPWRSRFDAVVSWFTAYGYFDDDDNRRVLSSVFACLRPGGRFVIELNNRDNLMRRWVPASIVEHDGAIRIDQRTFDPLTSRAHATWTTVRDGAVRRRAFFTRLFTFTELRDWLLAAGFVRVDGYGSDGRPLTVESPRMILVASKGA
jgi:SAM-dependent methyltransferase